VHTNPYARPWVGARLRATVAMASGSPSPASGLLPVPARQSHLCRLPQAHRSKDVHTNPCARPWVGARLRATVAMASGSPSPASGLLPVPARQCHLCRQPEAHRSKDVHTNPCARPWVGARLRATVAMASGSPSPASGLLPVPARQCHLCRQPQAHRSKDVQTNPCARLWAGARLRATVAMASGFSVARKRAPTGPSAAMSSLPTAPSSSSERRADQNPCARLWVGARLRATVAMASGSPSPASGLLPVPARQCHLCRQPQAHRAKDVQTKTHALGSGQEPACGRPSRWPRTLRRPQAGSYRSPARQCHLCRLPQAHRSKDVHTNPCARPWVGARLRATVAMASGSPSPASGLLPIPARQCHLCRQPEAHRSKDVHTNHTLGPG
jgi:hypothetical protein